MLPESKSQKVVQPQKPVSNVAFSTSEPTSGKKRSKLALWAILISTILLSIIAVLSAFKLQQLKEEPIAPNAPEKVPAQEVSLTPTSTPACFLEFSIPSPTPTATLTPTNTPTGTLTPSPTPTNTPTNYPQITNTPTPTRVELPQAGVIVPSQILIIAGSIVSLIGLLVLL